MYNRSNLRTENASNIVETLKKKTGVYKIYFNKPINRICNTDKTSLMYIGSTGTKNGLLKRIRDFFDSATNGTTAHSGGNFYHISLKNHIGEATEVLKFEYEIKNSDAESKKGEKEELDKYLTLRERRWKTTKN